MSRRSTRLNDKKCRFNNSSEVDLKNKKVFKFNVTYECEEKEHVFSMTSDNEEETEKQKNEENVAKKTDNYSESDSEDDDASYYQLVINNKQTIIPLIPTKQENTKCILNTYNNNSLITTDKISIEDDFNIDDYVLV
jgi:hypothetical protein